jgi:hypothetical protein
MEVFWVLRTHRVPLDARLPAEVALSVLESHDLEAEEAHRPPPRHGDAHRQAAAGVIDPE